MEFLALSFCGRAQTKEGPWLYGQDQCLLFSGTWPNPYTLPNNGGGPPYIYNHFAGSVMDSANRLLFWVKLHYGYNTNVDKYPNIYNALGMPMKGGTLMSDRISSGSPVMVPSPGKPRQFYVFYIKEGGLHYSVIDMDREGGLGEVLPEKHNRILGDRGKLIDQKLIAVPSCRGAWILVRDREAAAFLSYSLTETGLDSVPVVSRQGAFPADYYGNVAHSGAQNGHMRASPNGKWIAVASNQEFTKPVRGGLELFAFEPCSGKFGPSLILDTLSYFGVCFSPDNSKLYATAYYERTLYQFDLSLGDPQLIRASKTPLIINPDGGLNIPHAFRMGAIKRSPSGKLFLGNNNCSYLPASNAFHVVHQPNAPGLASMPQINAYPIPYCSGLELPNDYIQPRKPDTVSLPLSLRYACFQDSILLVSDTLGSCHQWTDGYTGPSRWVRKSGIYEVGYYDSGCQYIQQPFQIEFIPPPRLQGEFYSCPGAKEAMVQCLYPEPRDFSISWRDAHGEPILSGIDTDSLRIEGLDTGQYFLLVRTGSCDTLVPFRIEPKPIPNREFNLPSRHCTGQPIRLAPREKPLIGNWTVDGEALEGDSPLWIPEKPGYYQIQFRVQNAEGCVDSLVLPLNVEDFRLWFVNSDTFLNKGEAYTLTLKANLPFEVLGWAPVHRFPSPREREQHGRMDSTHRVMAWARTPEGCLDTAFQWLYVRPQYYIPSVFSPNGDGLNDGFGPVSWGPPLRIRVFEIYNRWGQRVFQYSGSGNARWDGRYQGEPAPVGTYGYILDLETMEGIRYFHKGDITLIR